MGLRFARILGKSLMVGLMASTGGRDMKKLISLGVVTSVILSLMLSAPLVHASSPNSGGPMPELTWTEGSPYPVVHGHTIFPPVPESRSASSSGFFTHWYAGGDYDSSTQQPARTITTTITTGTTNPNSADFYYVLVSAFDNNGSYDQLGFSADNGVWGLSYSWTSGNGKHTVYHYSANALQLAPKTAYTFTITVSGGAATFAVTGGTSWSLPAATGGTNLVLANFYAGYYDYTDYEEVWQTSNHGGAPQFNFDFTKNSWTGTSGGPNKPTWTTFITPKTPTYIVLSFLVNGNVIVTN